MVRSRGIELLLFRENPDSGTSGSVEGELLMRHRSMLRQCAFGLVTLLGLALSGSLSLQADEKLVVCPSVDELNRWVQELDAESYAAREAATAKLVGAGSIAVEPLARCVLSDSAEVAWRASTALQRIAIHGDEATINQVSAALQRLTSSRPALAKVAGEIKMQQQKLRHGRAIAKVRTLGGNLTGNWDDAGGEMMIAGGPVAFIEDAPLAIDFDEPGPGPVIEVAEAAPAPRGLFGLLARLIAPGLEPGEPPLPLPILPAEAIPLDIVPPAPLLEPVLPVAPGADEIPRFEDRPALPEGPVEVLEAEAIEVAVAEDVAMFAVEGFGGPGMIIDAEMGEEGAAYAELVLDKSFKGTDADLAVLKDIPELYSLSINGSKLSDQALAHIAELPRLTTLNVSGTDFSSAALYKLRKDRPALSIVCRSTAMLGINAGLEGPCVLTSVFFRSGAHEAGLKDGDEIIEVDGQKVRDFSDLTIAVYPHKVGDKLDLKYRRAGKDETATVVLKPRVAVEE